VLATLACLGSIAVVMLAGDAEFRVRAAFFCAIAVGLIVATWSFHNFAHWRALVVAVVTLGAAVLLLSRLLDVPSWRRPEPWRPELRPLLTYPYLSRRAINALTGDNVEDSSQFTMTLKKLRMSGVLGITPEIEFERRASQSGRHAAATAFERAFAGYITDDVQRIVKNGGGLLRARVTPGAPSSARTRWMWLARRRGLRG
jgi:hypothetical protein